ncbi:DUF6776 family protein [Aeromonas simiae]|uniref:DUF6776 family protein n=1 Tax=Aeromonas simiae TaxID=218936 RepID=UPI0005A9D187|nr:DUF6776 family protein [Aeromonas simiae]MDO2947433.1 hypothetical protein [Aeromonas simiae]MDO2951525.1 hypothetical protein [Aeromonas simiae]MDO2957221.1 hypothetical protein [Aeromonas simiae]
MLRLTARGWWLLGLLPGLLLGYLGGNWREVSSGNLVEMQQKTLAMQGDGLTRLRKVLEVRDTQLMTQKSALEQLQQTLKLQESQLQDQKRQLAFYERIMRPSEEVPGVVIDNLTLEATSVAGRVHYRLALIQPSRQRDRYRGQVTVRVEGSLNGKPKALGAADLGMKAGERRYALRYFQLLEGNWQLPAGFVPDKVIISIAKQGNQPAQKLTAGWNEVLKPLVAPAAVSDASATQG